jgi:hypothetical protein
MTGFTADNWQTVDTFGGKVASQDDVTAGRAVFALSDTLAGRPLDGPLPQPALWYEDDEEAEGEGAGEEDAAEPRAVLIVQAEAHETDTGPLEVLGLLLPDGSTAVGFSDDVDVVEASDPFWSGLVEEALFGGPQ